MDSLQQLAEQLSRRFAEIYYHCHPSYTLSLSHQAVRALQIIYYQPEATVSDLARELACAHNTASEIVQRLAEKDLLLKSRKGADERTVHLSLTPQGQQTLYEQTGLDIGRLQHALSKLSAEEQQTVSEVFTLLATSVQNKEM